MKCRHAIEMLINIAQPRNFNMNSIQIAFLLTTVQIQFLDLIPPSFVDIGIGKVHLQRRETVQSLLVQDIP